MKGQEFIILFRKDEAYLTPEKSLTLRQTNLPEIAQSFNSDAHWVIRVLNYDDSTGRLFCEVVSYHVGYKDFPANQKAFASNLKDVETVAFRSIDTGGLLLTLKSSEPVSIRPTKEPLASAQEPVKRTFTETFSIPIKDLRVKSGHVSFERKFTFSDRATEIRIDNKDLLEEFDAVKNYFANKLNTKKIQVSASLELTNNKLTSVIATSPEIDKINREFIDNVRFDVLKAMKKRVPVNLDKNLFTIEEYFDTFGEENLKSTAFYNEESELVEDLLKITDTKHYKQLRFLSSKHSHRILKLRFIHKPFSFVFLLEGSKHYHFVWETLDTAEATYVWHTEKDRQSLRDTVRKIDDIIGSIKSLGKTAYIHSNEDQFSRIYHDYSETTNGFIKWKDELERLLV